MRHAAAWILLACALLPFASTRLFPHVHDDHDFRGPQSLVADARSGVGALWRADVFGTFEQPTGHSGFWRPLILLGFAGEHALTEGRPEAFAWLGHVITILMHGLATLVLWRLLQALGLAWPPAFVVAAAFAAHPVHVESVAWISGRSDSLPTLLAWGGTLLLIESRTRMGLVLAGLALLAAPLAKESGVLMVGLAAPLAWCAGRPAARAWGVPLTALAAYALLRLVSFEHGVDPAAFTGPESLASRWWTWLSILPDLMRLAMWPGSGGPLHPVAALDGPADLRVIIGLLALVICALGAVRALRARAALPLFAWGLVGGTFLLLAPWVRYPLGYAEIAAPLYERHLYACVAAPLVGLVWFGRAALSRRPRATVLLGTVLAALMWPTTRARCAAWSSDEAFARAAVASVPRSSELWNHLGWALMPRALGVEGDAEAAAAEEALDAFNRAQALAPDALNPRLNHFILLAQLGREEQAQLAADALLRAFPAEPGVLDNVAAWHLSHRRWEPAVLLLEREMATGRPLPGARDALDSAREAWARGLPGEQDRR